MLKYEAITVADTAIGITASTLIANSENYAVLTVETATIRFTTDGTTTPSATVGHLAQPGSKITLDTAKELNAFRAFRTTGTSASIRVSTGRRSPR